MNNSTLYKLWGGMFVLCAGLGFIPQPVGLVKALLVLLGVCFFLPGGLLLRNAAAREDRAEVTRIRNLSALSLAVSAAVLVMNFLSVTAERWVGDVMYGLLVILSSPMICCQYWAVSLFLWACLLMTSLSCLKKLKNRA